MNIDAFVQYFINSMNENDHFKRAPKEIKLTYLEKFVDGYTKNVYEQGFFGEMISDLSMYLPAKNDIIDFKVKKWCKGRSGVKYYNDDDMYLRYYMCQRIDYFLEKERAMAYV